jgi:hypothetical protein
MKPNTKKIIWLTIFSIAMGYLETAVVVYLRKIYYPDGFAFPLTTISPDIAIAEFWREAATIIMLIGIGIISGKNTTQRFAFFIYSFAIWDLFYYIFLKVLLNWPESPLTWDILFLIPVPWVGPVIAPCIVSITMILLTLLLVYQQNKHTHIYLRFIDYMLFLLGSFIIIFSFVWDYIMYSAQNEAAKKLWTLSSNTNMFNEISNYVPNTFNWWLFGLGEIVLLFEMTLLIKHFKTNNSLQINNYNQ